MAYFQKKIQILEWDYYQQKYRPPGDPNVGFRSSIIHYSSSAMDVIHLQLILRAVCRDMLRRMRKADLEGGQLWVWGAGREERTLVKLPQSYSHGEQLQVVYPWEPSQCAIAAGQWSSRMILAHVKNCDCASACVCICVCACVCLHAHVCVPLIHELFLELPLRRYSQFRLPSYSFSPREHI